MGREPEAMQATQSKPTKGNTMNDGVMFIVLSQKQTELGSRAIHPPPLTPLPLTPYLTSLRVSDVPSLRYI